MLKECRDKVLEVGDVVCFTIPSTALPNGIIQEITAPLSLPGAPPHGMQKMRIIMEIEMVVPAGAIAGAMAILDKNGTEASEQAIKSLRKRIEEMRVGSGAGTLVAG